MSDADTNPAAGTTDHDAADDHGGGQGHEAPAEPVGPVDLETWGYAIGGGLIGLIVVAALFVANGG